MILAEKDISSYGLNTLGPLCLWQCFYSELLILYIEDPQPVAGPTCARVMWPEGPVDPSLYQIFLPFFPPDFVIFHK